MQARNALDEARQVVEPGAEPWVLEPSPPAVTEGPWFADDPVAAGDVNWREWVAHHPDVAEWASDRWLAAYRRLGPVPATYADTRLALHRLTAYVISPARQRANRKMALRWTLDGIGTPFFGDDEQIRIEGTDIVRQRGQEASARPITSLVEAAAFVLDGPPDGAWAEGFDVPAMGSTDETLPVDADTARFLADWYGFAFSALEELRADAESVDPSRVQLWPEHFDAAFDCLPQDRRATFGASSGDRADSEPYLYLTSAAADTARSPLWNATSFAGAILLFTDLLAADDQCAAALEFWRSRRALVVSVTYGS